eukprot:12924775-Prorocentrum_lima.AAC.1
MSSVRGHRVLWALFNTALQELGREKGALLHKRSDAHALTKQELQELCDTRKDLVQRLATWGGEIPTTSMQWHREGSNLEWIVRQMSWCPPWVDDRVQH